MLARLSIAVSAVVALVVGAAEASPELAMQEMRSAAAAGDTETFNRYVDYPQLRANLKRQWLVPYVRQKMFPPDRPPGPFVGDSARFAELEAAATESVIADLSRPEAVMYAVREGRLIPANAQDRRAPAPASDPSKGLLPWEARHEGPNRFVLQRFAVNRTLFDSPFALEMTRTSSGTWKLVAVRQAASW